MDKVPNFNIILKFSLILSIVSQKTYAQVDPRKCLAWGPGLSPAQITLPARYFFVQLVDDAGNNVTDGKDYSLDVRIEPLSSMNRCRIWKDVLDRKDGSYIVRYKVYQDCGGMSINVLYDKQSIAGFPKITHDAVLRDSCYCPQDLSVWRQNWRCPEMYHYIDQDLVQFQKVDMSILRDKVTSKFNKRGSMSLCHYVVIENQIHRKCHGQHVGFHIFMDAMLLSITRKVKLPDIEFFMNLGDWPLESAGSNPLPIFSWCGSDDTADIVLPTYDITESTLECMGRVQLDMLSVQGNSGPIWEEKQPKAFWRGRDSRMERLHLIDIARSHPALFNASLTNFFFFRDKEDLYGPKQPHVSFFEFFEYKYQICIDGTVAPYRFPYLLAGGSLVLKQDSPYYEHFYRELQPGFHYLPVARDLSNLVQQIEWAKDNDAQSHKIARQGALYAKENLMPTDIFCYHVVLLNEWSKRLISPVKLLEGMDEVPQPVNDSCDCGYRHTEL